MYSVYSKNYQLQNEILQNFPKRQKFLAWAALLTFCSVIHTHVHGHVLVLIFDFYMFTIFSYIIRWNEVEG